jgi:deoxyribose-phosphate aldolase
MGEVIQLCKETVEKRFASACILPTWVPLAATILRGSSSKVCSVVGFPLGATTTATKAFEAEQLVKAGADELDMVLAISRLKSGDFMYVSQDISSVVKAASPAIIKVIIETCLLTDDEIRLASLLCVEAGAHFVKTSTGFAKSGATIKDVALIRATVGKRCGVKASGGIKDKTAALAMIDAGASRIGTSSGIAIIEASQQQPKDVY